MRTGIYNPVSLAVAPALVEVAAWEFRAR